MRTRSLFLLLLALAAPVAAQKQSLGIFAGWGSFRDNGRCYAIAEPVGGPRAGDWKPFAAVGYWPRAGLRGQVHFRLSREKRRGSAVLLRIDDKVFQLVGGGADAWAPDRRADAEIVAVMRSGVDMSVETRSTRGTLMRDRYRLRGAATAIDAAALGCARAR